MFHKGGPDKYCFADGCSGFGKAGEHSTVTPWRAIGCKGSCIRAHIQRRELTEGEVFKTWPGYVESWSKGMEA